MIPDDEDFIDDDLGFLEIARDRVDKDLCDQLIAFCKTLLVLLSTILLMVWLIYRSSINHFYASGRRSKTASISPRNLSSTTPRSRRVSPAGSPRSKFLVKQD